MSPDFNDATKVANRLMTATANLHKMSADVGHAFQIKEFVGDMKKNLLSKYIVRALKGGEGLGAGEAIGRADPEFQRELGALQDVYEQAESAIARWRAENASYEAARSLLSFTKSTMEHLQG